MMAKQVFFWHTLSATSNLHYDQSGTEMDWHSKAA